jgi:hypothetical protein
MSEEEILTLLSEKDAVALLHSDMKAPSDIPNFAKLTALATETADCLAAQTEALVLTVREGKENEDSARLAAQAMQSNRMRENMLLQFQGSIVPLF